MPRSLRLSERIGGTHGSQSRQGFFWRLEVYTWQYLRPPASANPPTIVVLPFNNLGGEPANEYFAAGLTDEITDELVRLQSLKVLARTSAAAFKGKAIDVREVGRRLNVAYVLEGASNVPPIRSESVPVSIVRRMARNSGSKPTIARRKTC